MKKTGVMGGLASGVLLLTGLGVAQTARFDIVNYGAVGDGKTDSVAANAAAINRAIAAAARAGGGTVVVPPGDYMTGPITLLGNVTLYLEAGSIIRGSTRLDDYRDPQSKRIGGLIHASNAKNVAITGRGVIDGSAMAFLNTDVLIPLDYGVKKLTRQGEDFMNPKFGTGQWPFTTKDGTQFGPRPGNMIVFNNCDNLLVTGVTIQNSPNHTLAFSNSRYVDLIGVKINSLASDLRTPNDDATNFTNCRYVHIADCDIQTGDDAIAVFSAEDFTMTNCTLLSRSAAIKVENGVIRNGVFSNLVIRSSNRGIYVDVRDKGVIENLLFDNIVFQTQLLTGSWWGKAEPIHISAIPREGTTTPPAVIRNLRFTNLMADSEAGILIYGTKESIIHDIQFDRVRLKVKAGPLTESYGCNFDLRGFIAPIAPELSVFKHDIPGLYAQYVDGLKIHDFELEWDDKLPDFFSHGIECENVQNLEVDGFQGREAHTTGTSSAISLTNASGVTIRNSVAPEGTQTFLTQSGVTGAFLVNNDLSRAKVAISPAKADLTQSGNIMPPGGARKR